MNEKISLLAVIVLFLVIPQVSSLCELPDADIGSFARNSQITLWQTCPDCSFVNISEVQYPNSSVAISNVEMLKDGTSFTYNFNLTSQDGFYVYKTFGNSSAQGICTQNVRFLITPNGELPTTPKAFFYIGLLGLLVFFLCLIFWAHMKDQSQLAKFWWFSFMWIPIWAILFIGWSMATDFLTSSGAIASVLYFAWLVIAIVYPFFLLGLVLYTLYWIYQQKEVQRLINRGFSLEDAQARVGGRQRGMMR